EEIVEILDLRETKDSEFYTNLTDSDEESNDDMQDTWTDSSDDEEITFAGTYGPAMAAGNLLAGAKIITEADGWGDCDDDELETINEDISRTEVEYPKAGAAVTSVLKEMVDAGKLQESPAEVFRLIAENTNPGWLSHSFGNIVSIPRQC